MADQSDAPLTARQQRFVDEYLLDLNATQACIRAGYSVNSAEVAGCRLLRNAKVAQKLAQAQQRRSERTKITADDVLEELRLIALADPNELVEYRRICCRYCYGVGHAYQRTPSELIKDRKNWEASKNQNPFDDLGGVGYNATKMPHPDCPECYGEGQGKAYFKDTRKLSASGRRLYAGVKITKGGIEIAMVDKMAALVNVGKHLGMFDPKEPTIDASEVARQVREALRAMSIADGLLGSAA